MYTSYIGSLVNSEGKIDERRENMNGDRAEWRQPDGRTELSVSSVSALGANYATEISLHELRQWS